MRTLLSFVLLVSLVSCKQEQETPKVSYEASKSKDVKVTPDSSGLKVADLPILMEKMFSACSIAI